MRSAHLRPPGAVRPDAETPAGDHEDHDAGGIRRPLSGDRGGALRPGLARLEGVVHAAGGAEPDPGALSRGGEHASGAGRADGGAVRPDGGGVPPLGCRFDTPVAQDGYVWWYVDALSDDGRHGLTVIAFIGSVFSPYYALARRRGGGDPLDHCAVNVALYGPGRGRWAMTERGRASLQRSESGLRIGPSSLSWDGAALTLDLDEVAAPLPSRIRGRVRLTPSALTNRTFALDAAGRHRWSPIAADARVEVALERPDLRWFGHGYFDSNAGERPLEDDFSIWNWSRAKLKRGSAVLYAVEGRPPIAIRIDPSGAVEPFEPPAPTTLPRTPLWRIPREGRADPGAPVRILKTLEDSPFYSRSVIDCALLGETATAMHESLCMARFRTPWTQLMLPFRMPRAWRVGLPARS